MNTPIVSRFLCNYPALNFDIVYTDEIVDLVKSGFDLALRIGKLHPSRFKSIRWVSLPLIAIASPTYLNGKEEILEPQSLLSHDCLFFAPDPEIARRTFVSKKEKQRIALKPRALVNQMQSLIALAAAGAGVAFVPYFACREKICCGDLIRVLPDWTTSSYEIHLVSPSTSGMPVRVKKFADEIVLATRDIFNR